MVKERKRRKRVPLYSEPFLECDAPNKVWSADFKGQFRMGDGKWCYPLTLSDNMSRYLLVCRVLDRPLMKIRRNGLSGRFASMVTRINTHG